MTQDSPISGRLRFDPVLTWGHVLVAVTVLLSGVTLYASNEVRYSDLNLRVTAIESLNREYRADAKATSDRLTAILIEISAIKAGLARSEERTFPNR